MNISSELYRVRYVRPVQNIMQSFPPYYADPAVVFIRVDGERRADSELVRKLFPNVRANWMLEGF